MNVPSVCFEQNSCELLGLPKMPTYDRSMSLYLCRISCAK
uniref:Uncharacterized protein n=1 Tax=Arundo donax TaxID=35708 RepID=A0A0A8YFM7_ARUDO